MQPDYEVVTKEEAQAIIDSGAVVTVLPLPENPKVVVNYIDLNAC